MRHHRLSERLISARLHAPLFFFFAIVTVVAATPATSFALTDAQTSCRSEIAGGLSRYVSSVAKLIVRCHQERSAGEIDLGIDCNDPAEAGVGGKLERAADSLRETIVEGCTTSPDLLSSYTECPAPARSADDGGATTGIDDFGEVAACLAALGNVHVSRLFTDAEGDPSERILDPLRACQTTLGKGVTKIVRTVLGERRRCQAGADSAGGSVEYSCDGDDTRGRIARERTKYEDKTTKRCNFSSDVLGKLHACDDETAALVDCSRTSADDHASTLARLAYGLDDDGTATTTTLPPSECGDTFPTCGGSCAEGSTCVSFGGTCSCVVNGTGPCAPATIIRQIHARYGTAPSITTLSTGWSGKALDVDVPDHTGDTIDVTCDENCENCEIDLNTDIDNPASICRCTSDLTQNCSVINGSDPVNCGSVDPLCRCYFGAPLALSSGGTPACVISRIRQDYAGTMNLRTGEWHDQIRLASVVHLGISQTAPCPTCEGDIKPNDGVRDGTCSGGVSSNACDENGAHLTFGPTSLDCMPASAANVSGTGLLIDLNASTGPQSLQAALPCQTPNGALCPCRVCSGNGNLGCSSDAQCAAAGAGTCTDGGGAGVNLNACTNFQCNSNGRCTTGPVDKYCDGIVHPDGRGFISCNADADCAPFSAGVCSVVDIRRCFPDPILTTGVADPYEASSSALFCIAPTSNAGINITGGLPGPGKYVLSFNADIRCQNNPDVVYEFPSGANCDDTPTTTTTLLPIASCEDSDAPLCGGVCIDGGTCGDNGAGSCECTAPPLPLCDGAIAPVCGGRCTGPSELCRDNGAGACECVIPTLPQCAEAEGPLCGGLCPNGEVCQDIGGSCECGAPGAPACGTAFPPTCGGTCDVGSVCIASGDSCLCQSAGLPTCGQATAPACGGTCSLGSTCQASGNACQCITLPVP